MVLSSRVFSQESFSVTFSTTRTQDDKNLTFNFEQNRTSLSGYQSKVWEEKSIFEFGKLNEFEIEFSNKSIIFNIIHQFNKEVSGSIAIDGFFEKFNFIGFYSEKLTTWIVPQSKMFKCGYQNICISDISLGSLTEWSYKDCEWEGCRLSGCY